MNMLYVAIILFCTTVHASIPKNGVVGFSDWKNQKIKAAYSQYVVSQQQYAGFSGTVFERNKLYKMASRNYRVLEATRKLSIHDYFQMYLMATYPENQEALQLALRTLNQQQVAELLVAYQKSLRGKTQKLYIQRSK
jgi:hypothetical protein